MKEWWAKWRSCNRLSIKKMKKYLIFRMRFICWTHKWISWEERDRWFIQKTAFKRKINRSLSWAWRMNSWRGKFKSWRRKSGHLAMEAIIQFCLKREIQEVWTQRKILTWSKLEIYRKISYKPKKTVIISNRSSNSKISNWPFFLKISPGKKCR